MFSDVPNLLDRDYIIAYFLPATVLAIFAGVLSGVYGLLPWSASAIWEFVVEQSYLATAFAGLLVWMLSLALLGANRWLVRTKEGYLRIPLLRGLLVLFQQGRCEKLERRRRELEKESEACKASGTEMAPHLKQTLVNLGHLLSVRYPHERDLVLPWPFGNRLRAFETYPLAMYGLDGVASWSRLRGVIPKDYLETIDGARARVDFAINLWAVWWLLLAAYGSLALFTQSLRLLWFPFVAVACVLISSALARGAAELWGELVRSSFDLYLPELRRTLGLPAPTSRREEREQWQRWNWAIYNRRSDLLPELGPVEPCPHCGAPHPAGADAAAAEPPPSRSERPVDRAAEPRLTTASR